MADGGRVPASGEYAVAAVLGEPTAGGRGCGAAIAGRGRGGDARGAATDV